MRALQYSSTTGSRCVRDRSNVQKSRLLRLGLSILKVGLPAHDLCRVDRLHLVHPPSRRHNFPHRAHLVRRVAGDADVVAALENVLDVADVELRAVAELRQLAGVGNDIINEVVCKLEDRL